MKKYIILLFLVLLASCIAKHYVINDNSVARPTASHVFDIDKKNYDLGDYSVVDTTVIYYSDTFKINNCYGLYYRFFSNGVVQEVVLGNEPIDSVINDPSIGNVGHYKILKGNKLLVEILRMNEKYKTKGVKEAFSNIQKGSFKNGDLYLDITTISQSYGKRKGIYEGTGGSIGIAPIFLVDLAIPDKHICFHKKSIASLKSIPMKW